MELLSATDAIGPAFARTRSVLLGPDRKAGFFKLALVAALTQPTFFSVTFSYPMQGAQLTLMNTMQHRHAAQQFGAGTGVLVGGLAFVAAAVLIGLAVWVGITYLFCRLRFVLFDLVLYREGRVAPAWRKYRSQAWRYFGVLLLGMLVLLLLGAVFAGPAFLHMMHAAVLLGRRGTNANPLALAEAVLPMIGIMFALGMLWTVFDAITQDFLLPPIALEDAPIEGALGRFKGLLSEHTGQTLLYLLLRFVLGIGLSAVLMIAVIAIVGLFAAACIALGLLLFHAMWAHGIAAQAIFVAIVSLLALVVFAIYLFAAVSVYGIVGTFKESYALYFYGPRYPELGDRLDPPDTPAAAAVLTPPPLNQPPPVW